jgi:hypothetical protein
MVGILLGKLTNISSTSIFLCLLALYFAIKFCFTNLASCFSLTLQMSEFPNHKPENEDDYNLYSGTAYFEGEDGELSWFNAGVRVGVGIGLSVCLGIGIGVGLLVRTYQGTTSNFRRRLL